MERKKEMKTPQERAKAVWKRIVESGETGDDMAVEWIAQEIEEAILESKEIKE